MAAGVSALPMPPVGKLLVAPKVGTDFLSSSHFTISQDTSNASAKSSLRSIFKKDYVPWDISSRPSASIPPDPAEVLHRDQRFFNEKASETTKAYQPKPVQGYIPTDSHNNRSTNFKMDRDLSKFDSFHTTHDSHYTPHDIGEGYCNKLPENPMQSFIPQGDPGKAPQPISDYRDRYRGHAKARKPFKAPSMHQGGDPTITGDNSSRFATTHKETFAGVSFPPVCPFPAPTGTNIPQGDPSKDIRMSTIQQASFPVHDPASLCRYDKEGVNGKLQRTNFQQSDGHGSWDTYLSTMADHYQPARIGVSRSAPARHRNHSDFPDGDSDPHREATRVNMTTNRFYHDSPIIPGANIVSGANKRTKSNVWFGEPRLDNRYYETTVDSTFTPWNVPAKSTERPDFNTRSCVPVNYYPNERHSAVTWSDFQNHHQRKLIPDSQALEQLKKSHFDAPLGGSRQFNTEHLDQYTPKRTHRLAVDSGRLQRSTVPLGTLCK